MKYRLEQNMLITRSQNVDHKMYSAISNLTVDVAIVRFSGYDTLRGVCNVPKWVLAQNFTRRMTVERYGRAKRYTAMLFTHKNQVNGVQKARRYLS